MFGRAALLLTIAASGLPMPAAAQAPAPTTAFDGKYVGVSRESTKAGSSPGAKCQPNGVPASLTIRNGLIGSPGSKGWEGTVNPQGGLTMRSASTPRKMARSTPRAPLQRSTAAPLASPPSSGISSPGEPALLAAEVVVDEGDDDIKAAVAGEIFVPGLGRKPALPGVGRGIEQGATKADRDDTITFAMQDQDRRSDPGYARERVEAVDDHQRGRHIGEVALGDLGGRERRVPPGRQHRTRFRSAHPGCRRSPGTPPSACHSLPGQNAAGARRDSRYGRHCRESKR